MTDADLHLPYSSFDANAPQQDEPIYAWIVGDTFGHYEGHRPWMEAIVGGSGRS